MLPPSSPAAARMPASVVPWPPGRSRIARVQAEPTLRSVARHREVGASKSTERSITPTRIGVGSIRCAPAPGIRRRYSATASANRFAARSPPALAARGERSRVHGIRSASPSSPFDSSVTTASTRSSLPDPQYETHRARARLLRRQPELVERERRDAADDRGAVLRGDAPALGERVVLFLDDHAHEVHIARDAVSRSVPPRRARAATTAAVRSESQTALLRRPSCTSSSGPLRGASDRSRRGAPGRAPRRGPRARRRAAPRPGLRRAPPRGDRPRKEMPPSRSPHRASPSMRSGGGAGVSSAAACAARSSALAHARSARIIPADLGPERLSAREAADVLDEELRGAHVVARGGARGVRRHDHGREPPERALGGKRLDLEDVERGARKAALGERRDQCRLVDERPAADVHDARAPRQEREPARVEDAIRLGRQRERDDEPARGREVPRRARRAGAPRTARCRRACGGSRSRASRTRW